jgi:hypothetical protein
MRFDPAKGYAADRETLSGRSIWHKRYANSREMAVKRFAPTHHAADRHNSASPKPDISPMMNIRQCGMEG